MGNTLVAVGGAFLAAGLLARAGRRIGLPTIPFFMAAGIIFGPNTPGIAVVDLNAQDIVRHRLVQSIVEAYEADEQKPDNAGRPDSGA